MSKILLATLSALSIAASPLCAVTITLQEGQNGYTGTTDVSFWKMNSGGALHADGTGPMRIEWDAG